MYKNATLINNFFIKKSG